ncbi:MAG: ACP S-malonyltransferase [Actinomycetota bacterium]
MRIGLFPGQGISARDVYEALTPGDGLLEEAGAILGYDLAPKVAPYSRRKGALLPTWLAQPAIFVAGVLAHRRSVAAGTRYHCYAGHSMGEYTALVAAEALSFKDGLKILSIRGREMQKASVAHSGGMLAVLSLDPEVVIEVAEKSGTTVVNDNAPGQIVLAGDEAALGRASRAVSDRGGRAVLLGVSGAFHTEAMASVRLPLQDALFSVAVRSWARPVISNVTARPYRTPGEVRKLLTDQVTSRVRFRESLLWAFERGVSEFEDLGPGGVVGGLADRVLGSLSPKAAAGV